MEKAHRIPNRVADLSKQESVSELRLSSRFLACSSMSLTYRNGIAV